MQRDGRMNATLRKAFSRAFPWTENLSDEDRESLGSDIESALRLSLDDERFEELLEIIGDHRKEVEE